MPMFEDETADIVVLHHQLEHLDLTSADVTLKECRRILRPGGSLLVFVPDLFELTRAWMDGKISDYTFCVNLHGAYMGDEADVHRWSYTAKTLLEMLLRSGRWTEIRKFDWREILGSDIARDWWILGMEAIK